MDDLVSVKVVDAVQNSIEKDSRMRMAKAMLLEVLRAGGFNHDERRVMEGINGMLKIAAIIGAQEMFDQLKAVAKMHETIDKAVNRGLDETSDD